MEHLNVDVKDVELSEIDITKAFTYAFSKITKVPVFNVFDKWLDYEGKAIDDFTLYVVKVSEGNLFFNKEFNLVYGMFLKKFMGGKLKSNT
jgi:hypothetical protein